MPNSAIVGQIGELYPAPAKVQMLECLYDRLSVGEYVIVDDYGNVSGCRQVWLANALIRKALTFRIHIDLIDPQRPSPRR